MVLQCEKVPNFSRAFLEMALRSIEFVQFLNLGFKCAASMISLFYAEWFGKFYIEVIH